MGSIPACAGETNPKVGIRRKSGVHPRVCGGNVATVPATVLDPGPSPRVRGKHGVSTPVPSRVRSIPACAGETHRETGQWLSDRVHPRVCGGNLSTLICGVTETGPSPRVRGKPGWSMEFFALRGSIPACAGETTTSAETEAATWVHPRVCGGKPCTQPFRTS